MPKTIGVLGGGSAGLTAATTAAELGARVALFMGPDPERASLCVNRGCMPSKALFARIDAAHRAGWATDEALAEIVEWKNRHIARFRAFRQRAIRAHESEEFQVVRSPATLVSAHEIESAGERYSVDAVIVATGSEWTLPPIDGLGDIDGVWTSDDILDNTQVPDSLVVIGAGAVGLEFSIRYARLGSAVTVVTHSAILPHYPKVFGERLTTAYEREGVRMLPDRLVTRVERDIEGWFVCHVEGPSGSEPLIGQRLLVATGRRPQLAGLGLDRAGIKAAEGRLAIGSDMRIAGHDHVFAVGDVTGDRQVVHHAHIEAGIAAHNAVEDTATEWSKRANLQVVFSDPEFAYAGLTPAQIVESSRDTVVGTKDSRNVGKLLLGGDDVGVGRFVADASSGELLSAGLLCDGASDIIHLPSSLIELGHTVHDAAKLEFYHPARIEIVSGIIDALCEATDGEPLKRAPE